MQARKLLDSAANCAFLLAASYVIIFALIAMWRTLVSPAPGSPWEAHQLVDAWRFAHGLPVYVKPDTGPAPHMYGALLSALFGSVVRIAGPSLVALRLIVFVFALIAWTFCVLAIKRGAFGVVLMLALLLGFDQFAHSYSVTAHPDMIAIAFALVGMRLAYLRRYVWASVFVLLAFLMKQPAAMVTVIPPMVALYQRRSLREIAWATLPFVVVVATMLFIKFFLPNVWHAIVVIPGSYRLTLHGAVEWTLVLARLSIPLAVVLAFQWWGHRRVQLDPWLVTAAVVTVPASILIVSKLGGTSNSLLPALVTELLLIAYALSKLEITAGLRALLAVALIAAFPRAYTAAGLRSPDRHDYHDVIDYVKRLPGRVVVPEDPTIPLLAGRDPGANAFVELDAHPVQHNWSTELPQRTLNEVNGSEWVVDVLGIYGDPIRPDRLRALGFTEYADFPHHVVWRRSQAASQPLH